MMSTPILEIEKRRGNKWQRLALACTLLMALAVTARLHAQTFIDWYDFNCDTGGCSPVQLIGLTQGGDGNLYGMDAVAQGQANIIMLTPVGGYTDLLTVENNPTVIREGLTLASDGNFYGVTCGGGTFGHGSVFRFTPPNSLTVLYSFNGSTDAVCPQTALTQGKDGNLYGVVCAPLPDACDGVSIVYRVTLPAGTYQKVTSFPVTSSFLLASDGNLYAKARGGRPGFGRIIRMSTSGAIKVIYFFSGNDGEFDASPITQGSDGYLYGVAQLGANGAGEIFKTTLSGTLTVLHSFDAVSPNPPFTNNDGAFGVFFQGGLLAASDGYFYGAAPDGGANGFGTIFRISSSGSFSKLFDFDNVSGPIPGNFPRTTLMQHTSGPLYGLAEGGGSFFDGVFYSLVFPNINQIIKVAGPIFVKPGVPVQVLGNNMTHVIGVNFGGAPAQFDVGSDTYLIAQVPNDAIDGLVTATYDTGLQVQTVSAMHILPVITNLDPSSGPVGTQVGIVGGGLTRASKVAFGGVKATNFTVVNPTLIQAIVPTGAKTGKVKVTTPNGTATSPRKFTVN